jgi:hypothetical protein
MIVRLAPVCAASGTRSVAMSVETAMMSVW